MVMMFGNNKYLLHKKNGEQVGKGYMANYILERLYGNLGETAIFKIVINHIQKSKNSLQMIRKFSKSRGTAIDTIAENYDINKISDICDIDLNDIDSE
jgi:hypothetical protein